MILTLGRGLRAGQGRALVLTVVLTPRPNIPEHEHKHTQPHVGRRCYLVPWMQLSIPTAVLALKRERPPRLVQVHVLLLHTELKKRQGVQPHHTWRMRGQTWSLAPSHNPQLASRTTTRAT